MAKTGGEMPQLRDYENGSIQTTCTVFYRRVEYANPTATKLLQLWAYLDHQEIWYGLFSRSSRGCQDCRWLQNLESSKIDFERIMKTLIAYSLVESRQDMKSYSVHPVVHDWCAVTIGGNRVDPLMLALLVVGFAVPDSDERKYWLLQRRLIPHAERCMWQFHHLEAGRQWVTQRAMMLFINLVYFLLISASWPERRRCISEHWIERRKYRVRSKHTSTLEIKT